MCVRRTNGLARPALCEWGNLGNVGNLLAALSPDKCKPRNREIQARARKNGQKVSQVS